ncbi:2-oxoglutarate dehydrogenase, E2 component, dihydrolipoamide succinyltransferase [Salinibacter ruber]|uniref:2-oxoglutarate dehydrogenase, E2 component, dihydrolipoamide succinyltransferase n=1 Tax=Salinibacter ruber TaxID=146919 RepID=UPI000E59703B|nr:2-oxoglutarate dehydrogenase, E2 component, dihydrolipoamide succinyltransferase [Salinibacter ruber]MCS3683656.1 2-oxoglutarate dehydrogenase E2 component (dihydrolipoamide succinyltransferase) [Salinibacter ruber]MCS3700714.1 2-oxoglutarate dehydrogenase E2 component (dihydrolipoamide succinyltransferase) [Salinibacter ruber]MCS3853539.1 2-oxoglutarate dehydrogenase E2 component (dihydrolipoamide succinyltransferase) [Salinibacter ruber]MCS4040166.1 2-oxoglutarate dehydrogenase E2 componen
MAQVDVEMPKMGESITEGTVIAWHKQPGDEVEQDEILLEIGTDKVDTEVPSPKGGVLTETLVEEGDTVEVGTIIATLDTDTAAAEVDADDAPPAEAPSDDEAAADEAKEAAPDADAEDDADAEATPREADSEEAASPAPSGDEVEVVMPKMGESITEGTVVAWYKDIGEAVAIDETILEIGTDKVDTEVPSPAEGVLTEKLVEEGETVEVGTVVALLASEAEAGSVEPPASDEPDTTQETAPEADEAELPSTPPSGDGAVPDADEPQRAPEETITRRGDDGRFYSPLVRSIAKEEGLRMSELESLEGSGRGGRVTKEDVLAYLDEREEAPAAPASAPERPPRPGRSDEAPPARGDYTVDEGPSDEELRQQYGDRIEVQPMDRMRKMTAEHMVRSKATSAHVTSFAEADVTGLVQLREANKEAFREREGVKLTYTPFFVKAAVEALREHPLLNASVEGDKIVIKHDFHVGIAVAIGNKGLLAPVIRNAGDYNVSGLARKAANVAERARNKELQPDELQGGTFTVTNIGSLGSLMGTPIINQPQVGILATGAIQKRPVVVENDGLGDAISVRHMMYLSLSYDHRIIDGAMGSSFLQRVVTELESFSADADLF